MTHGTYLALNALADAKIKAGTTNAADAEALYAAKQKLNHVATLNFADEEIVNEIEEAKVLLDGLTS